MRRKYEQHHPDWELVEATAPDGPWVKALAVNPAVQASTADIVIVADADVWVSGLKDAVAAVAHGDYGREWRWAIPHHLVHRLSREATAMVLAGADFRGLGLDQRPYVGVAGGGFIVAPRKVLLDVPLDPRFVGWGQEDVSIAIALTTLHGAPWRARPDLVHLWHPPAERANRKIGTVAGRELWRRYQRARHDPVQLRRLIEEGQACLSKR